MTDDLIRRAITVIANTQGLPEQDVVLDASLVDLGIDSLDGINILFALEEEFDITIPDEAVKMKTIRQMCEAMDRLLEGRPLDVCE